MFKSFDSLEIKRSEFEGRYIVATRDIEIGEDILKCKSYFSITCEDFKKNSCFNCIKLIKSTIPNYKPPRCNECNEIWYCSDKCKQQYQAEHLHYECKFYKKLKSPKLIKQFQFDIDTFSEIRMVIGLLSRYHQDILLNNKFEKQEEVQEEQEDKEFIKDSLDGVLDLVENIINEKNNKPATELIHSIYLYLIELIKMVIGGGVGSSDESLKLIKEIKPLIHKIRCNQFGVWTKTDKCIGMIVSPSSSYFNHSCIPNCESIRDGNKMTFKPLYPIKKGDKISISYIELDKCTKRRKSYLEYGYYFDCNCPRCNLDNEDNDQDTTTDDSLDNWISKFYCHQKKCAGLYYSKLKITNTTNKKESIDLHCSTCDGLYKVSNSYFNDKPNF